MNDLRNQLAATAGMEIKALQHAQLDAYLDLLFQANQTMNLTRIVDRPAAEAQHICDALTLLPFLPREAHRLADVGSGGGVPGIPLAIVRPDAEITLIESTKKKAAFLRSCAEAIELKNLTVLDQRVEDVAHSPHRESFDIAVARAVATMDWLAEWCLPLVRIGGTFLAMKGPKVLQELPEAAHALHRAGGSEPVTHPANLPGADHHLIIAIAKARSSDKLLPRSPTTAKGKPIR